MDPGKLQVKFDQRVSRPSCVAGEVRKLSCLVDQHQQAESILGAIHLDLALYHETCR